MEATSKWIISGLALTLGAVGIHEAAMAETTQHGTICNPTGNSNRSGLAADSRGVRNALLTNLDVVCPVVRTRLPPETAFVDFRVDGEGPATCTAFSFGPPDGGWRGQSATVPVSVTGPWSRLLRIDPGRARSGSYQSVVCTLAPGARLFGIRHPY